MWHRRWLLFVLIAIVWIALTSSIGLIVLMGLLIDYTGPMVTWPGQFFITLIDDSIDRYFVSGPGNQAYILLGVNTVLVVVTQMLFLLPVFRFNVELGGRKSLRLSMVVAAIGAAMLTLSLLMGVMTLAQFITGTLDDFGTTVYLDLQAGIVLEGPMGSDQPLTWVIPAVVFLVSWALWSMVLLAFVKRRTVPQAIRRVTGVLVAGTLLEVLLLVPLEAMVRRRADCYCATGSFQALFGSLAAGVWLLGPGLLVLIVLRRPAYFGRYCPGCGQAKGPRATQPRQCSECGRIWLTGSGPAG
jgi:hypothetical protein